MKISMDQKKSTQEDKSKKGGLRTLPFIIANETFEKLANVGLHVNMIMYLREEYHYDPATATVILFLWAAVSNFMPIIGAFLSDSYIGRFQTISWGTVINLLGLILLLLTSIIPQARPPHCKPQVGRCERPNGGQFMFLVSSFALLSIGAGGIRPCSLAFGADQLHNPENPQNGRLMKSFFSWYYVSVGVSITISTLLIVYIQYKAGWVVGYAIPVGLMLFSTLMFFLGSSMYVKVKANKSLFTSFAQVIVVAWKNRQLPLHPDKSDTWYFHKGSNHVEPSEKLRFLNKACIIKNREKDLDSDGMAMDPCSLCSVRQVEEFKALIKVLPMWSTGIVVAIAISQYSFAAVQASTMDRHLFNFEVPPTSYTVFAMLSMTIWVAFYDRVVLPLLSKYTKSKGFTLKQRMGIGIAISSIAMAVAAMVERKRRNTAIKEGLVDHSNETVSMSAMWMAPQHCLVGLGEAFNVIGQIEFYYSQFPKSMSSIAVALLALGFGVGNLLGSLIVTILKRKTQRGGRDNWLSENINKGHYDYYYWLLCFMSLANLLYFIVCSLAYGDAQDISWDEEDDKILEPKKEIETIRE